MIRLLHVSLGHTRQFHVPPDIRGLRRTCCLSARQSRSRSCPVALSRSGTGPKLQRCGYRQAIVLVYNPLIVFSKIPWRTHSLLVHVSNKDHGRAFSVRGAITEILLNKFGFLRRKIITRRPNPDKIEEHKALLLRPCCVPEKVDTN
jgi:hypothetical protein